MPHSSSPFVVITAFLLLVLLARWLFIARSNIAWGRVQATVTAIRFRLQRSGPDEELAVTELELAIERTKPVSRLAGLIGWNAAHQVEGLVLTHELDRRTAAMLPPEELLARFERELGKLDSLPAGRRQFWESVRDRVLAGGPDPRNGSVRARRAYLLELLRELHEADELKATRLSGLYNRATWLVLVAVLAAAVLAGQGFGALLSAGAVGGVISRMQRLVFTRKASISFGSSWVPLFCAPVLGALAAWGGLMLIALLKATGVLSLDGIDVSAAGLHRPAAATLGLAVLLGLSERILNQLEQQASTIVSPEDDAGRQPPAPAVRGAATIGQAPLGVVGNGHRVQPVRRVGGEG
jgi:hypothetical protein